MTTNPVIEAIKSRRAIRSFEDKPIPDSAIETLLEAATYAPSAINIQPWKFTIITNKDAMKNLSDTAKPALIRMLPDVGDEGLVGLKKRLSDPKYNIFYNAPLLIFVSGIKSAYSVYDCSMAAQNMMLAAYSLGLGSCWIGTAVALANEPKVKAEPWCARRPRSPRRINLWLPNSRSKGASRNVLQWFSSELTSGCYGY